MKFLNSPWRVVVQYGEALVLDSKGIGVAGLSLDPEDLSGSVQDEKQKAFGIAALPMIYDACKAFLDAMGDPVKQLDEELISNLMIDMESALALAEVPTEQSGVQ